MPRDSGGIYTLPGGYLAVTGQTVLPSNHNPPLEDIATALTNSLPRNGAAAMTGNLNMGLNEIFNAAPGVAYDSVARLSQVTAAGIRNLVVKATGNDTVNITASELSLVNDEQGTHAANLVNTSINLGTTGAGGFDSGSAPNEAMIYLFVIWNGTTISAVASASATSPTLPSGYTFSRYVGAVFNNTSGNLYRSTQVGAWFSYQAGTNPASEDDLAIVEGVGNHSISLTAYLPATAGQALLAVSSFSNGYATVEAFGITRLTTFNTTAYGPVPVTPGSAAVYYINDYNGRILICGWVDNAVGGA